MPNGVQVLKALRDKRNEIIDFTYVFVNAAAENFAGKKITGKKLPSLFKGENKNPFFEKLVNVLNTGAPENFVHNFEDGIPKWFHYTINRFSDGVLITQEDITEREEAKLEAEKKEEQFYSVGAEEVLGQFNASLEHQVIERTKELRENNALLQNFKRIIDTAHDSVISVDTDGNVTYWNPASRNAYGYREATSKFHNSNRKKAGISSHP